MKKIILLLLLPIFAFAQAPTQDSVKLTAPPAVANFTPQFYFRGANASNMQVGFYNSLTGKWGQLVTGHQINQYYYDKIQSDARYAPIAGGGYVPYTGATTNIVSTYDITASSIISNGNYYSNGNINSATTPTGGHITFGSTGVNNTFGWKGSAGYVFQFAANNVHQNSTYFMPDATGGTLALTSDIPSGASYIQNSTSLQSSSNFHISDYGAFNNGAKIGWNGTYFGVWGYGDSPTNANGRILTDGNLVTIQSKDLYNIRFNAGTTNAIQINGSDKNVDIKTKVKLRAVDYGTVGNDILVLSSDTIKRISADSLVRISPATQQNGNININGNIISNFISTATSLTNQITIDGGGTKLSGQHNTWMKDGVGGTILKSFTDEVDINVPVYNKSSLITTAKGTYGNLEFQPKQRADSLYTAKLDSNNVANNYVTYGKWLYGTAAPKNKDLSSTTNNIGNLTGPITSVNRATALAKNIALNGGTASPWNAVDNSIDIMQNVGASVFASSNTTVGIGLTNNAYLSGSGAVVSRLALGNASDFRLASTGGLIYNFKNYGAAGSSTGTQFVPFQVDTLGNESLTGNIKYIVGSDATNDMYYRKSDGFLQRIPIGTNGQILTVSSGVPAFTTGGTPVVDASAASYSLVSGSRYITSRATLVTFTLPTTATLGQIFIITGGPDGTGLWKVAQNSGQTIHGATNTTTGTGGSVTATGQYNSLQLVCTKANTDFTVQSSQGSLTII